MDERPWAEREFGGADLHDPRRTERLVQLAAALGEHPCGSLPEALPERAELVGAYRFFANDCIDPTAILPSHVRATYQRLAAVPLVLAAQDTTLLDYTAHPATEGLGRLGNSKTQGLVVHTTLAFTLERVPLGLLAQEVWARAPGTAPAADHKTRPIADKESQKWLTSLNAVAAAKRACPATQFVSVGDREADVYDLFVAPRPAGVDLLVRAAWDRCVDHPEGYLWATVQAAPVAATVLVSLPRHGAQPARTATLTLRFRPVTLRPPRHRTKEGLAAVTLWAVLAIEPNPPPGAKALEWLLLTTVPVETVERAEERLAWYGCRWGIEVWHLVLKSGCRLEAKQLAEADRLRRCLAVLSVVAWRILYATMLARDLPDAPASLLLDRDEWEALCCAIQRVPTPPAEPPSLRQAVRWLAQLGGFQARAADGEPGVTVLWRGFQHLADLRMMYAIMKPSRSRTLVCQG
jgi:hypothetical protein